MRKLFIALGVITLSGAFVAPALGHTPHTGSHEEDEVVVACEDSEGNQTEPAEDGSCPEGTTPITETQWDNDVTCGETDEDDVATPVGTVYTRGEDTNGDGQADDGTIEACADGSEEATVLQGRIIATGNAQDGGYVAADGDKDNPAEAQGYIRVDVSGSGVTVTCDDPEGNQDATHPGDTDTQEQCGA